MLVRIAQIFARRGCSINSVHITSHADGVWSDIVIEVRNIERIDLIVSLLERLVDIKRVQVRTLID